MTTQDLNEMKSEFKGMTTKELKSYSKTTKFMSILFRKTTPFLTLFVVIFGVAAWVFLTNGASFIIVVAIILHFILYKVALKIMPNLEEDRKECELVHSLINEELSSRK